jgi:hypothetical protein
VKTVVTIVAILALSAALLCLHRASMQDMSTVYSRPYVCYMVLALCDSSCFTSSELVCIVAMIPNRERINNATAAACHETRLSAYWYALFCFELAQHTKVESVCAVASPQEKTAPAR